MSQDISDIKLFDDDENTVIPAMEEILMTAVTIEKNLADTNRLLDAANSQADLVLRRPKSHHLVEICSRYEKEVIDEVIMWTAT